MRLVTRVRGGGQLAIGPKGVKSIKVPLYVGKGPHLQKNMCHLVSCFRDKFVQVLGNWRFLIKGRNRKLISLHCWFASWLTLVIKSVFGVCNIDTARAEAYWRRGEDREMTSVKLL